MFLTQEQIDLRLGSQDNLINIRNKNESSVKVITPGRNGGRSIGALGMTEDERLSVAILASAVGDSNAAEAFGISQGHVNHLKNGRTDGTNVDREFKEKAVSILDQTKTQVETLAAEKLLSALGMLDHDKLANAKVTELAQVASSMSKVMVNMRVSENQRDNSVKVSVILHQPRTAREEHFDMIEVSA